jgi:hypothetical protein
MNTKIAHNIYQAEQTALFVHSQSRKVTPEVSGIVRLIQQEMCKTSNNHFRNFLHELMCTLHIRHTLRQHNFSTPDSELGEIIMEAMRVVPDSEPATQQFCLQFVLTHRAAIEAHLTVNNNNDLRAAQSVISSLLQDICNSKTISSARRNSTQLNI